MGKSKKQIEKQRENNRERLRKFNQKKEEEQALKDAEARQAALEKLGITQKFDYADHAEIYNSAGHREGSPMESTHSSIPDQLSDELISSNTIPENFGQRSADVCDFAEHRGFMAAAGVAVAQKGLDMENYARLLSAVNGFLFDSAL